MRVAYYVSSNCKRNHIPTIDKIRMRQRISSYSYAFLVNNRQVNGLGHVGYIVQLCPLVLCSRLLIPQF
jgi:hypothetical protein